MTGLVNLLKTLHGQWSILTVSPPDSDSLSLSLCLHDDHKLKPNELSGIEVIYEPISGHAAKS